MPFLDRSDPDAVAVALLEGRAHLHGEVVPQGHLRIAVAEGAGDAEAVRGEVGDREHEVGHGIGDRVDIPLHEPGARDLEHLVLDHVAEVERLEQEPQGALQRDRLVEGERHRRVAADVFLVEPHHVEVDGHVGLLGQGVDHHGERLAPVGGLHLGVELLVDRHLGGRGPRATLGHPLRPRLRQVLPVLRLGKLDRAHERRAGGLHVFGHVEVAGLPVAVDRLLGVEAADHPALGEQLADHGVVGGELACLLGDRFGLGKPPLVHEGVVFLDEHRDPLVHLDLLRPLAVDLGLDLGGLLLHRELVAALAGGLLDILAGPLDPAEHLRLRLFGELLVVEPLGGLVEQVERVGRRLLRHPLGFELLGRHFGADPGHEQALGRGGARRRSLRGRGGGGLGCLVDRIFDHPAGRLLVERLGRVGGWQILGTGPAARQQNHRQGDEPAWGGRHGSAWAERGSQGGEA